MRTKSMLVVTAALAAMTLGSPALAAGAAVSSERLPAPMRTSLQAEIAAHRAKHPEMFERVRTIRGIRPEHYGKDRNPVPNAVRELKRLGPTALLPMLDALAFHAPPRGELKDHEWNALKVGLFYASGLLRDPRGAPIYRATLESGEGDPEVLRAAAEALGRLCRDEDLAFLQGRSAVGDPLAFAAIRGLGQCRRLEGAQHLASLLDAAPDAARTEVLAESIGTLASSWAWRALGPEREMEALAVRDVAARALLRAFPRYSGEVRTRIGEAVLMAEHPDSLRHLAEARGAADAQGLVELARLERSLRRALRTSNPK